MPAPMGADAQAGDELVDDLGQSQPVHILDVWHEVISWGFRVRIILKSLGPVKSEAFDRVTALDLWDRSGIFYRRFSSGPGGQAHLGRLVPKITVFGRSRSVGGGTRPPDRQDGVRQDANGLWRLSFA